jgi:hypothetical protein
VWEDADWAGRWIWVHADEASSVPLSKRPDEVPDYVCAGNPPVP